MATKLINSWPMVVGRLLVGLPLIVSGLIHLAGPYFFLEAVLQYQLVRGLPAQLVAMTVMVSSVVLGTAIVFYSRLGPISLGLSALLFLIFAVAQLSAVMRGLNIACGCFGATNHQIGWMSIGLSVSLFVTASVMYWKLSKPVQPPKTTAPCEKG